MKKIKRVVTCMIFGDGEFMDERREYRTVYTRADGSQYIRDWQGQKPLINGVYEVHWKRVRAS